MTFGTYSLHMPLFSFINRNALILSPINILKLNIKLGIADILVPSTCLYPLRFLRYSIYGGADKWHNRLRGADSDIIFQVVIQGWNLAHILFKGQSYGKSHWPLKNPRWRPFFQDGCHLRGAYSDIIFQVVIQGWDLARILCKAHSHRKCRWPLKKFNMAAIFQYGCRRKTFYVFFYMNWDWVIQMFLYLIHNVVLISYANDNMAAVFQNGCRGKTF